jgi:hypothetical protein
MGKKVDTTETDQEAKGIGLTTTKKSEFAIVAIGATTKRRGILTI